MISTRQIRLNHELKKHNLDAFLISKEINIFYLLGIKTDSSLLIATPAKYFFITDSRFKEECKNKFRSAKNIEVIIESAKKPRKLIIEEITAKLKAERIGFEAKSLSFFNYQRLKLGVGRKAALVPVNDLVESLRLIKDAGEIKLIQEAIKITRQAFLHLKGQIKPGRRAIDLAREVEHFIRLKGASNASFDLIIAPGKDSSKPHAPISGQIIKNNQLILADMGVTFKEYNSDLTRTIFLGKIPSNLKKIKEIVTKAQSQAIKAIKPGVEIALLDKIARDYITAQGYGQNFLHSLGHGVGLQVHESPAINSQNLQQLREGMVFTVEPGIYLPGVGGVRIEDMVLVTKKGCAVLSDDLNQSV